MILINFYIAFFAIFISPHIFIYYRFPKLNYSLVIIYSLIASFTSVWIITLLSYYFKLPNKIIYIFAITVFIYSIYYLFRNINKNTTSNGKLLIWIISILALMPIIKYFGTGFTEWDALVSWHKWALELYNNDYKPIHAAYPVLIPSLLATIYKIQGTSDIWWTAKISLYTLPLVAFALPLFLYKETKKIVFIFISIFLYPYIIMRVTIEGAMDMPVMLMGIITLTTLYIADINKNTSLFCKYLYASILLAGLSTIIKQPGFAYLLFVLVYTLFNYKYLKNKKTILIIFLFSFFFFITFLMLYYSKAFTGATGNLDLLKSLSAYTFAHKELLLQKFLHYPPNIPLLEPIAKILPIKAIIPYLVAIAFLSFLVKGKERFNFIAILSIIFLVIGFFLWGKYASYHERNSYWLRAFLIIFLAHSFSIIFNWLRSKKNYINILYIAVISILLLYFNSLGNNFAYKKQKEFQTKLGREELAKYAYEILKDKPKCVKIYTNDYSLLYNYHINSVRDKIVATEFDLNRLKNVIENNCSSGSYIVFRKSTQVYSIWYDYILRLIFDKVIINQNKKFKNFFFYIPPNTKLPSDFFEKRSVFENIKLKIDDNNVIYNIENIKDENNHYFVVGWAFSENVDNLSVYKYLVLKGNNKNYIILTMRQLREDISTKYKNRNLKKAGFKAIIYKKDFEPGDYELGILIIDKHKRQHFKKTNKIIHIP